MAGLTSSILLHESVEMENGPYLYLTIELEKPQGARLKVSCAADIICNN